MNKRDIYWGYAAQILNIGFGLIMLPVIVHYMSSVEVGLWFVFMTLISLAQLLEFGFLPTLSRNFAYVYAGAQKLSAFGLEENGDGKLNTQLLADLIASARFIYRWIALLACLVLIAGGSFYISTVLPKEQNILVVYGGWFFFVIGNVINFYYGYLNSLLQGRGDVTEANKVIIASKCIQVLIGLVLVLAGYGLLGLGIASLVSTVVSRVIAKHFVYSGCRPEMDNLVVSDHGVKDITKIVWHNASRFGVVLLGVFLIWRANILIASSFLGLADAASYGLAIQLFSLINTIATVPFNLALPKLNTMRAQGKKGKLYQSFSVLLFLALIVYLVSALSVIFFGNYFLSAIGSSIKLPNDFILSIMAIVFLLEINHGTCANFITTGNQIPFVKAAIFTGIGIVVASIFLTPTFGIVGLVISQGLVQVAYNNWKWPMEVGKIFNVNYSQIIWGGFLLFKKNLITKILKNQ